MLFHAAFVADEMWGYILEPARIRARIYEEDILNRIDSNRLFLLIDLKSIRFRGKIRPWVLSGNHVLFSKFYDISKKHVKQHPADKYRGEQMTATATACIVACSPPTASIFLAA